MKEICFLVNIDWFFHSHRRPLEKRLAKTFKTTVIAGDSGFKTDYPINKFQVNSRVPTLRGVYQLYKKVKELDEDVALIVVSPVMIILCHFLFRKQKKIYYNFSGLGFLRGKSNLVRSLIMKLLKLYPVNGSRIFVVQNSDDFKYLNSFFHSKKDFHLELIAGSGYEEGESKLDTSDFGNITLGYVGRIRKDKGILNLLRSVSDLKKNGYDIDLVVWGELDEKERHGFNQTELAELDNYKAYMRGVSNKKSEIFCSFNWFCLPSNGEGISKAAIEASSFGLPLVLSNVQGNRDMVKNNGFLFNFNDSANLKKVLIDITGLTKEEYLLMSKNSRKMFEENWTMDLVYSKWNDLLNKYDTIST